MQEAPLPTAEPDYAREVKACAQSARQASRALATVPSSAKNAFLAKLEKLLMDRQMDILNANARDLEQGKAQQLSPALLDRLLLTADRIASIARGVQAIARLPDPVGEEMERLSPPNGLDIRKIRVPLGVIGIIYESRPNVTIDCACLCLKAGNASILRGGKEAIHTNRAFFALIQEALREADLPKHSIHLFDNPDRRILHHLLKQDGLIDCLIPRGGEALIRFVAEHASVPVLKHYKGICSLTLHTAANPEMAIRLVLNAKTQRPGVCNAIENLFLDASLKETLWPRLAKSLHEAGVEMRLYGSLYPFSKELIPEIPFIAASEEDFHTEYLDKILAIRTFDDLDEAIAFTHEFGSAHSDGIITENAEAAEHYLRSVDSATVYWNASTRFTDGFEFGFGAEIGISTDHLHARGPVGLKELTSYKYLIYGKGEVRT